MDNNPNPDQQVSMVGATVRPPYDVSMTLIPVQLGSIGCRHTVNFRRFVCLTHQPPTYEVLDRPCCSCFLVARFTPSISKRQVRGCGGNEACHTARMSSSVSFVVIVDTVMSHSNNIFSFSFVIRWMSQQKTIATFHSFYSSSSS